MQWHVEAQRRWVTTLFWRKSRCGWTWLVFFPERSLICCFGTVRLWMAGEDDGPWSSATGNGVFLAQVFHWVVAGDDGDAPMLMMLGRWLCKEPTRSVSAPPVLGQRQACHRDHGSTLGSGFECPEATNFLLWPEFWLWKRCTSDVLGWSTTAHQPKSIA